MRTLYPHACTAGPRFAKVGNDRDMVTKMKLFGCDPKGP